MAINVNQVDDDLNNLAKTSLGQHQNVIAAGSGVATTIASRGNATGTTVNPGSSGRGGYGRPGKRLYNPLSKLASYTYNISLYMITPDAYEEFVASGRQKIEALMNPGSSLSGDITSGAYIIAQSGGINNSTSARAPGFELDYYIDNLKFKTMTSSKSAGTNTSAVADFSFTITEPYGFSFLTNLKRATDALKRYNDNTEYKLLTNDFKQIYILGIRFYGYDVNGIEVTGPTELFGEPIDPLGSGALFENYYDIQISNVKFRLDGKAVVYNFEAVGMNAQALLGIKRSRIPTGLRVQGSTVSDTLTGPNGLFTKINQSEVEKVSKSPAPDATFPNRFEVVFQGDAAQRIGNASIVTQSDLDKIRWPGSNARNTTEATEAKGAKPPDPNERMFTFNNDTSIMQAIEQIIKKSSYMEQALKTVYSNTKQPDPKSKGNPQVDRENPVPLAWYNVSCDIRSLKWDPKLQDWAYVTSYVITTYEIPAVMTPYAPDTKRYYGAHKRYDYWFTGQNSEVLDYQLTFNNLFFNTVLGIESKDFKVIGQSSSDAGRPPGASGAGSGPTSGNGNATSNNQGTRPDSPPPGSRDASAGTATAGGTSVQPGVKSNANRTGTLAVGLEVQNSIVTSLHDIEAFSKGQIRILGDPDFLIRDAATSLTELYNKFYDTNGYTISAQGGQIFIEVKFNEAKDYKDSDGLLEINENIFFLNYPQYIKDMTQGAIIYELVEVDSVFSSGTFTQTLHLIMAPFDTGEPAPAGNTGPAPGASGATGADPDALKDLETDKLQGLDGRPLGG